MLQEYPLISIIIPTKNRRFLLAETLLSVRNQTYSHWEAIVVDDESTDSTWSILEDLADQDRRIRPMHRLGTKGGADTARNQGFTASSGNLILFLDSDDLLAPAALEERVRLLSECPEADAAVGEAEHFRSCPGEYHAECVVSYQAREGIEPLDAFLSGCSPWCTSGPLWRRAALEKTGPWKTSHDNQFHIHAIIKGVKFVRTGSFDWFIRNHSQPQVSKASINDYPTGILVLDDITSLLRSAGLLTRRRRRMLAWRCLLESMTCACERANPSVKGTRALWGEARIREVTGFTMFICGEVLIFLQFYRFLGRVPREVVRFLTYLDLKAKSTASGELIAALCVYLRYLQAHYISWKRHRAAK